MSSQDRERHHANTIAIVSARPIDRRRRDVSDDRFRHPDPTELAIELATDRYFGAAGAGHYFATHSPVVPRAGGRLHGPDDAQAKPREVDGGRRAIASVGHRTGSPRLRSRRSDHRDAALDARRRPGADDACLPSTYASTRRRHRRCGSPRLLLYRRRSHETQTSASGVIRMCDLERAGVCFIAIAATSARLPVSSGKGSLVVTTA